MKLTPKLQALAVGTTVLGAFASGAMANAFVVNGDTPTQDDVAVGVSPVVACQEDLPVDLITAAYDSVLADHPIVGASTLADDGCIGYAASVTLLDAAGEVVGTCGEHDVLTGAVDVLACVDGVGVREVTQTVLLVDRPSALSAAPEPAPVPAPVKIPTISFAELVSSNRSPVISPNFASTGGVVDGLVATDGTFTYRGGEIEGVVYRAKVKFPFAARSIQVRDAYQVHRDPKFDGVHFRAFMLSGEHPAVEVTSRRAGFAPNQVVEMVIVTSESLETQPIIFDAWNG